MEGRDIGTVVFPHADLKIYLDASPEARAQPALARTTQDKGPEASDPLIVVAGVLERDRRDREREVSPLVRASDAVVVDNTAMDAGGNRARHRSAGAGEGQGRDSGK